MNGPHPGEAHLPVLPLSQILLRLEKLDALNNRELKDLLLGLGMHVVNLSNKVKGLEGRLERCKSETCNLGPDPQRAVDLGSGVIGAVPIVGTVEDGQRVRP